MHINFVLTKKAFFQLFYYKGKSWMQIFFWILDTFFTGSHTLKLYIWHLTLWHLKIQTCILCSSTRILAMQSGFYYQDLLVILCLTDNDGVLVQSGISRANTKSFFELEKNIIIWSVFQKKQIFLNISRKISLNNYKSGYLPL